MQQLLSVDHQAKTAPFSIRYRIVGDATPGGPTPGPGPGAFQYPLSDRR